MSHGTERRVLSSTFAAYGIQAARLLVGFVAKLVLARLILPDGHGLYELALRIVTVAAACRDLGLPYHLMRDPRKPYGTVLVATLGLGAAITVALVLLAPAFGGLNADLPLVVQIFAVWVLLDGLAVVPKAFFERELEIGRLVAPEVWRALVVAGLSIGLAAGGWGVWSLVAGDLVGAALLAAYSWWRAWGRVPLAPDLALLPDLVRKSSYLFVIWVTIQLVTYLDIYVIEWFRNTTEVGLYSYAYRLAFLTATIVYPRALFPTLVEYLDDRPRFLEIFRLSAIQLLGCQVIAGYFLLFNAERSLALLYGPDWVSGAPVLAALAFVPFFDQFSILGGEMLKARHEDRAWLVSLLLNLVSLVGFGIVFTRWWGGWGMAVANYLLVGNLLMAWLVWRVFGRRFWRLLGDFAVLYAVPLPIFAAVALAFPAGSWPRFAASLGAAALAFGLLALGYRRAFRSFFGPRPAPGA